MGRPEDTPGFIEEALRHRQVESADGAAITDDEHEPADEPKAVAVPEPQPGREPRPAPDSTFADWPVADRALVDEALKKAGVVWLHSAAAPGGQAYWHVWVEYAIYLLTGGPEQPDGGLQIGEAITVVVASKDNRARLLSFGAVTSQLKPADPDWDVATTALAGSRLNLPDVPGAPARWAGDTEIRVFRVTPTQPDGDRPGSYRPDSNRAAPRPTSATTSGAKPRVLHRRHGSGRPLS